MIPNIMDEAKALQREVKPPGRPLQQRGIKTGNRLQIEERERQLMEGLRRIQERHQRRSLLDIFKQKERE